MSHKTTHSKWKFPQDGWRTWGQVREYQTSNRNDYQFRKPCVNLCWGRKGPDITRAQIYKARILGDDYRTYLEGRAHVASAVYCKRCSCSGTLAPAFGPLAPPPCPRYPYCLSDPRVIKYCDAPPGPIHHTKESQWHFR